MSDNEEEFDLDTTSYYKPSYVLIAIDTHDSMFVKNEEGTTPFLDCITACYELADNLILKQNRRDWSQFAIVLANQDDKATFINFDTNVLDVVKKLKQTAKLTNDELRDLYLRKGVFELSDFFLLCMKKFLDIKSAFYARTLIYVTNVADPVQGDNARKFKILNEVQSLQSNNITFQLITTLHDFKYSIFYNELFHLLQTPCEEVVCEDKEGLLEKFTSIIVFRYFRRKMNFFPTKGNTKRYLKINVCNFIAEAKLLCNAQVTTEGKEVKRVPVPSIETASFKLKDLELSLEDKIKIATNDFPVGYTLLYVSNRITDIGFISCDPKIVESSRGEDLPFYNDFWQYCVNKNKVLVCMRKNKEMGKLSFVEFIPKYANGSKIFLVKDIPFANEISLPPIENYDVDVSDEMKNVTKELIDNLTFDYDPHMFADPVYDKKKAYVKAKLLDEPLEEVNDLEVDTSGMDKIATAFKEVFGLNISTGSKRKTAASQGQSKRRK